MKVHRVVVVAAALYGASCGVASLDPVSGPTAEIGLVAHWTFDDGSGTVVSDSSTNRRDGALTGGKWTNGRFNGALFLKRGDLVTVSNFPQASSSWTVSLWVRFAAGDIGTNRTPLIGNEMGSGGWEFNAPDDPHSHSIEFNYQDGSSRLRVTCCAPQVDTWMHITGMLDGNGKTLSLFEGETLRGSTTVRSLIAPGATTLSMAAPNQTLFQGTLDEIRIYSRVLTMSEIILLNRMP